MTLLLSSLVSGVCFLLLWRYRLPYPPIAGLAFLAGHLIAYQTGAVNALIDYGSSLSPEDIDRTAAGSDHISRLLLAATLSYVFFARTQNIGATHFDPRRAFTASDGNYIFRISLLAFTVSSSPVLKLLSGVPSIPALLVGGQVVASAGLAILVLIRDRVRLGNAKSLLLGVLLIAEPLSRGFLGYGITALIPGIVALYWSKGNRYKPLIALSATAAIGVLIFGIWFHVRTDYRSSLGHQASTSALEVPAISEVVDGLPFAINTRLNQNLLLADALILSASDNPPKLPQGHFVAAASVVVPRAVWPGKPVYGGSGDIVQILTGRTFAAATSIGAGLPLELITLGSWWPALLVYILAGLLCQRLDSATFYSVKFSARKAVSSLSLGLTLNAPLSNMAEVIGSIWSVTVFSFLIFAILRPPRESAGATIRLRTD